MTIFTDLRSTMIEIITDDIKKEYGNLQFDVSLFFVAIACIA